MLPKNPLDFLLANTAPKAEEGFASLVTKIEDIFTEVDPSTSELSPKKMRRTRIAQKLARELMGFDKRFKNGMLHFSKIIEKSIKKHSEIHREQLSQDRTKLARYFDTFEAQLKEVNKAPKEPQNIPDPIAISPLTIDVLYQAAQELYKEKHYQDAADCFVILTFLDSQNMTFWLGLGSAEYSLGHYDASLLASALAEYTNPHTLNAQSYIGTTTVYSKEDGSSHLAVIRKAAYPGEEECYQARLLPSYESIGLITFGWLHAMPEGKQDSSTEHPAFNKIYVTTVQSNAKYSGLGRALMQAAVEWGYDHECEGRTSLLAIDNSHGFYYKLGMRCLNEEYNKSIATELENAKKENREPNTQHLQLQHVDMYFPYDAIEQMKEQIRKNPIF